MKRARLHACDFFCIVDALTSASMLPGINGLFCRVTEKVSSAPITAAWAICQGRPIAGRRLRGAANLFRAMPLSASSLMAFAPFDK